MMPSTDVLVRWLLPGSLQLGCLRPPCQIVGKAWERTLKICSYLSDWPTLVIQRFANGTDGYRARNHHHAHFGKRAMQEEIRAGATKSASRVADDRCRSPEPLLQIMIHEIF